MSERNEIYIKGQIDGINLAIKLAIKEEQKKEFIENLIKLQKEFQKKIK